jgi:hypothetical protein
MTDGQSVCMYLCQAHSQTSDQILLPVRMLLSESYFFNSLLAIKIKLDSIS